jgi:CHAT domain-containing protein
MEGIISFVLSALMVGVGALAPASIKPSITILRPASYPSNLQFRTGWSIDPRTAQETLILGTEIEREIRPGERHQYKIDLLAGAYCRIVMTQRGVDLTSKVYSSRDELLASGDRPTGMYGPKTVHHVAAADESCRLEVASPLTQIKSGKYSIKITDLRPATARDRKLVEAQRIFAEAIRLQEPDRAIEKYLNALAIYHEVDDLEGQALTSTQLGRVASDAGNTKEATEWDRQAIRIWRQANDRYGEARAINNLGAVYLLLGELQAAWDTFQSAMPIWREIGDRNGEARTSMNIGVVHSFIGDRDEALRLYKQAEDLWQSAEDRRGLPLLTNNIGLIYAGAGASEQALDKHRQALELARQLDQKSVAAMALNDIGEVYAARRDEKAALRYFDEALAARRQNGEKREEAMTLLNIAFVHAFAGRRDQALDFYAQSLALARETNHLWVEAGAVGQTGELLVEDRPDQAREHFSSALAIYRRLRDLDAESATLFRLAKLERREKNMARALDHIDMAVKLAENSRAKVARHDLRTSFFATRQDYFDFYIDLLSEMHEKDPSAGHDRTAWQMSERASARSLLELLAEARADIRQGIAPELIEQERRLRLQMAGKTKLLLDLLNDGEKAETAASEAELRQLQGDLEQAMANIRAASPQYAALTEPRPITLTELQRQLDVETVLLQFRMGEERSHIWVITKDSFESHLLPGRSEIEQFVRKVYELLTMRLPHEGETPQERIRRLVRAHSADREYWGIAAQLSRLLLEPAAEKMQGKRLVIIPDGPLHYLSFAALPDPAARPENGAVKKTLATADPPPRPLVDSHEIVYLPSASTLASIRQPRPNRPTNQNEIAIFADPIFSSNDSRLAKPKPQLAPFLQRRLQAPQRQATSTTTTMLTRDGFSLDRLPGTLRQAKEIASLVPPGSAMVAVGFKANRDAVINAPLNKYRRLLFSTHALLDEKRPALSGIMLSRFNDEGAQQNGFLSLQDIYNLNLSADEVVLSACQTALGQEIKGEGVIGLTHGFLYSGATRVISSFWKVEDNSTYELMKLYYLAGLKEGLRPAAALRKAQGTIWRRNPGLSPYFWAGFALHGEWK